MALRQDVRQFYSLPTKRIECQNPVGFEFYPGAQVGYSKVVVQAVIEEEGATSRPGSTTHEYYTTRDFPTVVRKGHLSKERWNPIIQSFFINSFAEDKTGVSQGYTVEVNDMHGKSKKVSEYDYKGGLVTSSEYIYSTRDRRDGHKGSLLNNLVPISERFDSDHEISLTDSLADGGRGLLGFDCETWFEGLQRDH